jgi:hypothetical protein
MKVVDGSAGEKMSAVLLSFIGPYQDLVDSRPAFERLIVMAILAWNVTILDDPARQGLIDATRTIIVNQAGSRSGQDFDDLLASLIQRKERYFADNSRLILDYRVSETEGEYRVAVVSTPART